MYFPFPLLLTQYGAKAPTQEERRPPRSLGSTNTYALKGGLCLSWGAHREERTVLPEGLERSEGEQLV